MSKTALACAVLLVSAAGASAQEYDRTGLSLTLGAIIAIEDFDLSGATKTGHTTRPGLDIRAGYRFLPWLEAELEYNWYDSFDIDEGITQFGALDLWYLGANAKAYVLTGQFQPYALVGGGLLTGEIEGDEDFSYAWKFGAGVDLHIFTDAEKARWVVYTEGSYRLPHGDLDNITFWTTQFGIKYRF